MPLYTMIMPRPLRLLLSFIAVLLCTRASAKVTTDIEYGRASDAPLLLDVSSPDEWGSFPVVILVHGGGWTGGDKKGAAKPNDGADITPLFGPLTQAKFVWFSINYRLAPAHRWPACLEDVQTAIRWVKAHAREYKGDPERIALVGHSAGGQLVCLSATLAGPDTRVQAVVGLAAVTDLVSDTERRGGISSSLSNLLGVQQGALDDKTRGVLADLSPLEHVKPGLPPFLMLHGSIDKTVPYAQSVAFQTRMRSAGNTCDIFKIAEAPHRLTEWAKIDPAFGARMCHWLHRMMPEKAGQANQAP